MQVTKEGIERIKTANSIVDVVAERGISLKRKGRQLVASCPFHKEKTASFNVSSAKGLFHCFGCGTAGDVIGFVTKYDKVSFSGALETLARRTGLDVKKLMEERPRVARTPLQALTPPPSPERASGNGNGHGASASSPLPLPFPAHALLARVVEHYHRTFCEREDAQAYLIKRGITDTDLIQALKVGYAEGSLLKSVPGSGEVRDQLVALGVITTDGRELLGGCVVVPIPDPLTGQWTNLYGRGVRTARHCYLSGPLRGVLNFQAARSSEEVVLTESVLDALSFHQAGIFTAIPLYGTNGFTPDHLDLLKREGVKKVTLALDSDEPGRKATDALKGRLIGAGIAVRVASFPAGIKDPNELLVSRNGDASETFRAILEAAEPRSTPLPSLAPLPTAGPPSLSPFSARPSSPDGGIVLAREGTTYQARVHSLLLGRLRVTVKASRGEVFHVDTLDLYASRARSEFARRAGKVLGVEASVVEGALLALLVEAEKAAEEKKDEAAEKVPTEMSESERAEALGFLKDRDLLGQVARDIDALGYVGEQILIRLLYMIAISRKLDDPSSAIVLSQSGAGKSGATEVIERLTPPEDVVLFTRLTPQSLYYTEPGVLDHKLVVIEERYGSVDADYSVRILQSRKKLSVAVPIKDPSTGNLRTKVFMVEARAAFIEATTASSVNHENATRCFELQMDESEEQTKRIHERQKLLRTERGLKLRAEVEAICRRHWNAQRLLEPLPVVIPFADRLSFPSSWLRTRRDFARFLNLIEVSAFLHQHQRERRGGAIVASVDDYATAYALAAQVLKETLSDLKKPLREALERIRDLLNGNGAPISRRQIRDELGQPDSTVRRWLAELVDLEYLEGETSKGGQGKSARYKLAEGAPREDLVLGLLTPEDLRKKLGKP